MITIIDQAEQTKTVCSATIFSYNPYVLFGVCTDNRKTWLGRYSDPAVAAAVRDDINRAIAAGKRFYSLAGSGDERI